MMSSATFGKGPVSLKQSLLMITPENDELHRFRRRQFNNFTQLTMPYLAGFVDKDRHGICVQAGVIFGFDSDTLATFAETLEACESLGIDGVTASILTPFPGTPIYQEMKRDGRLRSEDWSCFNGKTQVAFTPRAMTAEELLAGTRWFRSRFHAFPSLFRRMAVARTNPAYTLLLNLGYRWSL